MKLFKHKKNDRKESIKTKAEDVYKRQGLDNKTH